MSKQKDQLNYYASREFALVQHKKVAQVVEGTAYPTDIEAIGDRIPNIRKILEADAVGDETGDPLLKTQSGLLCLVLKNWIDPTSNSQEGYAVVWCPYTDDEKLIPKAWDGRPVTVWELERRNKVANTGLGKLKAAAQANENLGFVKLGETNKIPTQVQPTIDYQKIKTIDTDIVSLMKPMTHEEMFAEMHKLRSTIDSATSAVLRDMMQKKIKKSQEIMLRNLKTIDRDFCEEGG